MTLIKNYAMCIRRMCNFSDVVELAEKESVINKATPTSFFVNIALVFSF